ncbi:unnamed protein product [Phytophthora lilii]|uniref:Unnamed protein product n=1 Tax=Phytophthora lilii TaxID=2077276 RepID=A0A9W6TV62_9STRA|nr:unnamed protein product [Phytophthora lilii]
MESFNTKCKRKSRRRLSTTSGKVPGRVTGDHVVLERHGDGDRHVRDHQQSCSSPTRPRERRHAEAPRLDRTTVGFTLILVVSLVGTAIGSFLPPHYTGLLGFVPMLMGLWRMQWWCTKVEDEIVEGEVEAGLQSPSTCDAISQYEKLETPNAQSEATEAQAASGHAVSGEPPLTLDNGVKNYEKSTETTKTRASRCLSAVLSAHTIKNVGVTLANGGDNVAIYVPVLVT